MKVITTRSKILIVAERWKAQYFTRHGEEWGRMAAGHPEEIYNKLIKLDLEKCSSEEVEAIIGNFSWTRIFCDDCKEYVHKVVQLGEEPDYDSSTVNACVDCLKKALKAVAE